MSLRELQQQWQQGTLDESAEPLMPHIINPEDRAMIYIEGYRSRLIEALEKTFLLLREKMGDDDFWDLALHYIDHYPSEYFTLSKFGQNLSLYLKKQKKKKLTEIAELDWAISHAVDAKTVKPITRDALQTISEDKWNDLVFKLHPSLTVLEKYRVYRKRNQVYYVAITPQEKVVLQLMQKGKTFGEICEALGETLSEEEVVNYVIQQLLRWIEDELIYELV